MMRIVGSSLISAILYVTVKKYNPEYAVLIESAAIVFTVWAVYPYICDLTDLYLEYMSIGELNGSYAKTVLKTIGTALITHFAADICRDSGENALAVKVEFAGKAIIIAMTIPMIKALTDMAFSVMGKS